MCDDQTYHGPIYIGPWCLIITHTLCSGLHRPYSNHCHNWLHHTSAKTIGKLRVFHWSSNGSKFVNIQATQIMSGSVFLVTTHNAYASTKPKSFKQAEVIFYSGRTSPMFTCVLRHYAFDAVLSIFSQILRRSVTARESVDFRGQIRRGPSVG